MTNTTTTTTTTPSSPNAGEHVLGAICWNELNTRDTKRAVDFYTKVVGWTTHACPSNGGPSYTEWVTKNGAHVGGMMEMPAEIPSVVPANWAVYINVQDVDAAVAKAVKLGAHKFMDAMDVPSVGRICKIADPTGAVIHLFKGVDQCAIRAPKTEPGSFCWVELLTSDPVAAEKFYTQFLGWTVTRMPMPTGDYTLFWLASADISKKSGGVGGMMKITPEMGQMPSCWLTYIMVEDVDAAAARATQFGGKVCCPPTDIPNVGRFAVATDPTGATFALYKSK